MKRLLRWLFRPQHYSTAEIIYLIQVQSVIF